MSLYLGLVFTSSVIIIPNSSQHLHHAFLASGAPRSFFATEIPTPSKGQHIHHSSSAGVSRDTWRVNGSQCCQLYLWMRCIPTIGTKTKRKERVPIPIGLSIVCRTNKIMLDNPNQFLIDASYVLVPNHQCRYMVRYESDIDHQYKGDHQQYARTPLLPLHVQSVIDLD